jgi:hypothetical protein
MVNTGAGLSFGGRGLHKVGGECGTWLAAARLGINGNGMTPFPDAQTKMEMEILAMKRLLSATVLALAVGFALPAMEQGGGSGAGGTGGGSGTGGSSTGASPSTGAGSQSSPDSTGTDGSQSRSGTQTNGGRSLNGQSSGQGSDNPTRGQRQRSDCPIDPKTGTRTKC